LNPDIRQGWRGAANFSLIAWAGDAARTEALHHGAAIGLLIEADAHHKNFNFDAEQRLGKGQGGTQLAGTGLGVDARYTV
jgi:hypothetical protein